MVKGSVAFEASLMIVAGIFALLLQLVELFGT
jgi:hypothetical protein